MIGIVAIGGVMVALVLTLARLLAGPTLYDRALAAKLILIECVLICAGAAVLFGDATLVDVAIGLSFGALVLAIVTLKFFRARSLQPPLIRTEEV